MPASDAQRNAGVELVFGEAARSGIHGANELVAVADFFVKKRSGASGIEGELRANGVAAAGEMVDRLGEVGEKDFEAVGKSDMVVLVFFDRGTKRGDNLRGAGLVGCVGRAQGGHEHVIHVHVHVHVGHVAVGGAGGSGGGICGSFGHVHAGHVGHAGRRLR